MLILTVFVVALFSSAFSLPQGDAAAGSEGYDCTCRAVADKPGDYMCKCGAGKGDTAFSTDSNGNEARDCTCKAVADKPGDYTCKCPSTSGSGKSGCTCKAVADKPGDYICQCGSKVDSSFSIDALKGEGADCICKAVADKPGDYLCKCGSKAGRDCTCKAVADKPGDYLCKCGSKSVSSSFSTDLRASASNEVVKTFVMCVRPPNNTENPTTDYLTDDKGKSIVVYGQWKAYKCKQGLVEPFLVNKTVYEDLQTKCTAMGYDHAQPSDDHHLSSYPFQYDGFLTEYYKHRTPFLFNHVPKMPLDRCLDVSRLRRRLLA